jgi:hypothetical protein
LTTPTHVASSSTTPPRAGSPSTTSTPPHVRVPLHVARQVMQLITPLVVDFSASRRLVIDYFASAAHLGASTRRAARHAARRTTHRRLLCIAQARCRLLLLRRASGCLCTSRGSSCGTSRCSSSTTPPRAGSSSTTPPRVGSSPKTPPCAGSSSTTSPPLRVRVPRHVARLVMRHVAPLVVDYTGSRRLFVD